MSRDKESERTKRNFANFVLNHIDNNHSHDLNANNVNSEFAAENAASFNDNNNVNSRIKDNE